MNNIFKVLKYLKKKINVTKVCVIITIVVMVASNVITFKTVKRNEDLVASLGVAKQYSQEVSKNNGELNQKVSSLQNTIKEKDSTIKEKDKEIEEYEKEIESLKKKTTSVSTTTKTKTEALRKDSGTPKTTGTTSNGYKTDEYGTYYEKTMRITNYCSCAKCCGKYAYNRPKDANGNDIVYTASGKRAIQMYTLGASSIYPFGTKMYLPGVGICEVMDRGSGVKSANHLDMYFSSHQAALNYGNHTLTVRIYV